VAKTLASVDATATFRLFGHGGLTGTAVTHRLHIQPRLPTRRAAFPFGMMAMSYMSYAVSLISIGLALSCN
jgi:hypothetical protein